MKILIIEDDHQLAEAMADYFQMKKAECDFAYNGASGLQLALEQQSDVIVLDVNMPKMNGYQLTKKLRVSQVITPILMLTACDTSEDQLAGFDSGIDDYVTKPCAMAIIWARLEALVRRSLNQQTIVIIRDLEIDFKRQQAKRKGDKLVLTPLCWKILAFIAQRSPQVVSRYDIEQHIWQDNEMTKGNLNVHLTKLRKAIDKPYDFTLLHTRINAGIQLIDEQEDVS